MTTSLCSDASPGCHFPSLFLSLSDERFQGVVPSPTVRLVKHTMIDISYSATSSLQLSINPSGRFSSVTSTAMHCFWMEATKSVEVQVFTCYYARIELKLLKNSYAPGD